MEPLVIYRSGPVKAAQSQALDEVLRRRLARGRPALARIALGGQEGLAFGRYQLIPSLLWEEPSVQRRLSGGRLLPIGPGILELSLAAPTLEDLTIARQPIRAEQLLNRSVRGLLRGLESLGLKVVYPGRDLITLGGKALAHVAFDIDEAGRPLVQFHLSLKTSLAEAASRLAKAQADVEGRADLLEAEACLSLEEALGEAPELERLLEAIAQGFSMHARARIPVEPLPEDVREESEALAAESFLQKSWLAERCPTPEMGRPARIPSQLGSFQVAAALGGEGRVAEVRLFGEFIAGWPAVEVLERGLRGCAAEWSEVARVVDNVLNTPPNVVLGLGPRRTIPDTIVKALARAGPKPS